ncbi:MAG: polysaccharide deacetylase family protein [Planctomycetia bacterium]|nr:polysaccharide deacetylase family protein [Planctomycetia bacterium]
MIATTPQLTVVMYHYVRDLPRSRFPQLKGMLLDDFRRQVNGLKQKYEMADQDSMLDYLDGHYEPSRQLCLLTFDDGLREHFLDVLPILEEAQVQGSFFLPTSCLEERCVLPVHKNHFLMAALDVQRAYRWDSPAVAAFKYLLNFQLDGELRDRILSDLFSRFLGDEREFAGQLYVSWEEAREMQSRGMIMGGHSHRHVPLAKLSPSDELEDLHTSTQLLHRRLASQRAWPFSYPYGKPVQSFDDDTVQILHDLDFTCAFSTEVGINQPGDDLFRLRRIDCKDVLK